MTDKTNNLGLSGELSDAGDSLARKTWRAFTRGTGLRLTVNEVRALHQIQGDGDWWQSFSRIRPSRGKPA